MKRLRNVIHPFEILYLAIAIATFSHTAWAAAYMFDGPPPEGGEVRWWVGGALIAIAVDVGMLMTSRFLVRAEGRQQLVLTIGFIIAAVTSFYFQVLYIAIHTPEVTISPGVSPAWASVLQVLVDARVLVIPLALPVLATVYTLARLNERRREEKEAPARHLQASISKEEQGTLPDGRFRVEGMSFVDVENGMAYGPYRSTSALRRAMKNASNKVPSQR